VYRQRHNRDSHSYTVFDLFVALDTLFDAEYLFLSNWLENKGKVEPKTVQGILRHARVQTTLDLYTQEDSDETLAAQGEYLTALGVGSYMVQ
jgi:hypothetical protein